MRFAAHRGTVQGRGFSSVAGKRKGGEGLGTWDGLRSRAAVGEALSMRLVFSFALAAALKQAGGYAWERFVRFRRCEAASL